MPDVFVTRARYEYRVLRETLLPLLQETIGEGISRGDRVILKPNLLSPAPPDRAVTTHPLVVRVVAEYLLELGARVTISDSPPLKGFRRVLREGGYLEEMEGLPVEFSELRESVRVEVGEPFGEVEISKEVIEADHVVNMPKLKTHSQMLLTLAVKNLFGTVVGIRKSEWHLRTGVDRLRFAELLYLIARKVAPVLNIMDGILALEGDGPGKGGSPVELGLLLVSTDMVAMDIAVCRLLQIEPERLLTNRVAIQRGYRPDTVKISGDCKPLRGFRLPEIGPLLFGPEILHPYMRRYLVERPVVRPELCRQCGKCWSICSAKAIRKDTDAVKFDYDRCIRCCCCIEVCPEGALRKHTPIGGRILKGLLS